MIVPVRLLSIHPPSLHNSLPHLSHSVGHVSQLEPPLASPEHVRSTTLQHFSPPPSSQLAMSIVPMLSVS